MHDLRPTLILAALVAAACAGDKSDPGVTLTQEPPIFTSGAGETGPDDPTGGSTSATGDASTTAPGDTSTGAPVTSEPEPTTAGPTGDDGVTIYDVQTGKIRQGTSVELSGVIVTSPLALDNAGRGTFYVAEPGGGEFSGIEVYVHPDLVAELESEDEVPQPGDVVDLTGVYDEFYDASQLALQVLDFTGSGAVPEPASVAAADVATGGAKAEAYEGCLVQVLGATVTAPVVMYGEFTIDDALIVDDTFFLPNPGPEPPLDTQFTALVGLMAYRFDQFKLSPRACDDLQGWDGCGL